MLSQSCLGKPLSAAGPAALLRMAGHPDLGHMRSSVPYSCLMEPGNEDRLAVGSYSPACCRPGVWRWAGHFFLGCCLYTMENCPSSGVKGKWYMGRPPAVAGAVSTKSVSLVGGAALLLRFQVLFKCVSIGLALGEGWWTWWG